MNFLPGWSPGFIAAADAGILLTQVLSATGEITVTIPNGVEAGDFIVIAACGQSQNTDTPDFSDPSGFTLLTSQDGSAESRAHRVRIYGKVAVGNEDGTGITVFTDADDARVAHCVVFRPSRAIVAFDDVDADSILTQGNPSAITVGTGLEYNLALTLFVGMETGLNPDISSRSTTPAQDGETTQFGEISTINIDTAFRWNMWNPRASAQAVTSDIGDTGSTSSMTSVAVSLT